MPIPAETGYQAWLRYAPQAFPASEKAFPSALAVLDRAPMIGSARDELLLGSRSMRGRILRLEEGVPREDAIVLGLLDSVRRVLPSAQLPREMPEEAFLLKTIFAPGGFRYWIVTGATDRGVLYGAFALLRRMALGEFSENLNLTEKPYAPIRWVNQWDNLDGSIERGYGGRSIFWEGGHARADLTRVSDYGRLLASVGTNGCAIGNVNADRRLLDAGHITDIQRIANALRPWGVRVVLSIDFGSPQSVGKLDTFDPLDPRVAAWWRKTADALYAGVPDLGGFLIKADSEGRVGPSYYHRSHADAANVVAMALAPHGGVLFYRGFVYDHHMDWRNLKNDRARAAYDNFAALDGGFDGNVVVQIKNGPIDFQVREPVSPLIGALEKTNQALELQITQEYMGQARALVFLVPQWKQILDFDLHAHAGTTPVKALAAGRVFNRPLGGFVGVANVGLDLDWMGNQFSQANLYGFGRLAWRPDLSAAVIADEWTRLTFGADPKVVRTVSRMQLTSWRAYEDYTGPFGLQTLTDIVGNHYGVSVEASEENGWGQWHRADHEGVGIDRSVATGTGYAGQYRPFVGAVYEKTETTPDDLLLFFHHVPYTHRLQSGETVIQSIYDSHYTGAAAAESYVRDWESLAGSIDETRFREALRMLQYQAAQAELWRDAVSNWFLRESGIPDRKGRVGHEPDRVEAEAMTLGGYQPVDVKPWEAASGGRAVKCAEAKCSAAFTYTGEAGWRRIRVRYFDPNNGAARFRLLLGSQVLDEWTADAHLPSAKIDGTTSSLYQSEAAMLRPGDAIRVEGEPEGGDPAALDYVEFRAAE